MDIRSLKRFEGKKLLWAGKDDESGEYVLLFEGMEGVSVPDFTPVDDGTSVAQVILSQKLADAESIMDLRKLVDIPRPKPPTDCSVETTLTAEGVGAKIEVKQGDSNVESEPGVAQEASSNSPTQGSGGGGN